MVMIGVYVIERKFANFINNMYFSSRSEKAMEIANDEVYKLYTRRAKTKNHEILLACGSYLQRKAFSIMIKFFYAFLEDDEAFRVLYQKILKRFSKEGLTK